MLVIVLLTMLRELARAPTAPPVAHELPLKMEIIGDFDGFYSFMLAMERLRRITRLPRLKVESVDRYEGRIKAEMVLSIFYEAKDTSSKTDRMAEGK